MGEFALVLRVGRLLRDDDVFEVAVVQAFEVD